MIFTRSKAVFCVHAPVSLTVNYTLSTFLMPNIAFNSPANIFGLLTTTIFIAILLSQLQQKYSEHDQQHGDHEQHHTERKK